MSITTTALDARRAAAHEAEADAEQAVVLTNERDDLHRDIARLERRRDLFAEIGAGRVEVPRRTYDPRFRTEIEWQPILSRKTGNELAGDVEIDIAGLRTALAAVEKAIKKLIA